MQEQMPFGESPELQTEKEIDNLVRYLRTIPRPILKAAIKRLLREIML